MRITERALLVASMVLPAVAAGQITTPAVPPPWLMKIGTPRDSADTTRQGVFLEVLGVGGLYSLNYEHRLGADVKAQIGFTKWSVKFLGPRQARTAAVTSIMREFHVFEWLARAGQFSETVTLEVGGGFTAGRRIWEEDEIRSGPFDPNTPPAWSVHKSPYVAMSSLVGVRVSGERNHDITWRMGLVPTLGLRDAADARRLRLLLALSAGYTW